MSAERLAIKLMVAQGVLFAAETALIHVVGSRVSVMQLALIRGSAGLVLALALGWKLGIAVLQTSQLWLQLVRGVVSLVYLWVMIYSFGNLPLSDATAISYTQVAYIAVFSILILGEPVSRTQWVAVASGIGGALLIAKPGFVSWDSVYLIALLGTSLNGLAFVLNRYLRRADTAATTMFYTNVVLVLGNLPALMEADLGSRDTMLPLAALLFLGPVGTYLGIVALKRASAVTLGPYTLVRLLVSVFGGVVIFHELPDIFSVIGGVLIVTSCVMATEALSPERLRAAANDFFNSLLRSQGPALAASRAKFRIGSARAD